MSIDLSSYSYEELIELEKQIKDQKTELRKQDITKDQLRIDCIDIFNKRFPIETYGGNNVPFDPTHQDVIVSYVAHDAWQKATESAIRLCDIATGNYDLTKSRGRVGAVEYRRLRFYNVLPREITKRYEAMYKELWSVFEKYMKEQQNKEK